MRRRKIDMLQGPIIPAMIRFAIPVFLTALLQRAFNAVDIILAGNLDETQSVAVAAVGSTTALTALMINFFFGCSAGSAVIISHAIGSRNTDSIEKSVHTAMLLSVILGGILTVLGVTFSHSLLVMMSTPEDIIGQATIYLQTYFLGMIPYMVYNFGAAILRTMGDSGKPLLFLAISGPIKIALTYLFLSELHLGVAGLALATTLSQVVSAGMVIASLMRRQDAGKLVLKKLRFSATPLKRILRFGIPAGIQSATYPLANVFIQSSINSLSHLTGFLAGNAAAISIEGLAEVATTTYYQTAMSFIGQNVGANRYDRVKKAYLSALGLSCLLVAVLSPLVILFGEELLGLYLVDAPDAVRWGMVRIVFIFAPLILQALMDTTSGAIRGLGIAVSGMASQIVGICGIRILWVLTVFQIPQLHTPQTLYSIYPISWIITFLVQLALFIFVYKKRTAVKASS